MIFEGYDLLTYFEIQHILMESGKISMTEYNAMLPWHLDIELSLIKKDQAEKAERAANKARSAGNNV